YSLWDHDRMPGVDIAATATLNLIRGDWLRRLPLSAEFFILLASGLVSGFGLCLFSPTKASVVAAGGALAVAAGSVWAVAAAYVWFPWLIVAGVQIPSALFWSIRCHRKAVSPEKESAEKTGKTVVAPETLVPVLPNPSPVQETVKEQFTPV